MTASYRNTDHYDMRLIKEHEDGVRESRLWGSGRPPGRKASFDLTYDLVDGYPRSDRGKAIFPLRLDERAGRYFAMHGELVFDSTNLEALKKHMKVVAEAEQALSWERYIELTYTATVEGEGTRVRDYNAELDLGDKRPKGVIVRGLRLGWRVVEYSSIFTPPGNQPARKHRTISRKGTPSKGTPSNHHEVVGVELPKGLIPYSETRVAFLQSMCLALTDLDAKIVELFRGSAEAVAARIDGAPALLALPAPKAKAKP